MVIKSYLLNGCWKAQRKMSMRRKLSFGYLWWIVKDCYVALRDGGEVIFINPRKKCILLLGLCHVLNINLKYFYTNGCDYGLQLLGHNRVFFMYSHKNHKRKTPFD